MRFRFRAETAVVAGVDAGLHKVLVILYDAAGRQLGEHRVTPETGLSGADRVDLVDSAIRAALASLAPSADLLAVGVGIPGLVDSRGRVTISPAIPEIDGFDLAHRLSEKLGCAVLVESDAHAATLGEHSFGLGRGASDLIYLVAGHRTSSGSIIDGKLHRGWSGSAGQVGELDYLPWYHAAEQLVSQAGGTKTPGYTALDVFSDAAGGDRRAADAVANYIDSLAIGLATLVLAIDPEVVVVGGGISQAGPELATRLRERLVHHARLVNPRVEISELGDRAAALGCIQLAMSHIESEVFDLRVLPRH